MGDLTKNLSRHEFACRCGCGFDTVDVELAEALQNCVDHFSEEEDAIVRIDITGPNRCEKHNADVGGAPGSQHTKARAADFKLFNRTTNKQIDPDRVANHLELEYSGRFGMGRYSNRTHFDTRTIGPARWDKR
jgi:uncharacterized protein YcbK (DUF882 family)